MTIEVRRAAAGDVAGVHELLSQVLEVHAAGRPDLFKSGTRKYSDEELLAIFADDARPVFVAVDGDEVVGHAFCVVEDFRAQVNFQDIMTLYIDDICVDEKHRGQHVATTLYQHVIAFAREQGFYNVTLNVWSLNPGAQAFYEAMGMKPYKIGMETIL